MRSRRGKGEVNEGSGKGQGKVKEGLVEARERSGGFREGSGRG